MGQHGNTPGYDGKFELGTDSVESPAALDEERDVDDAKRYNDVGRNLRESPAAQLYARGHIDEAQLAADGKYRMIYEASRPKPSEGVINPEFEPVDTSASCGAAFTDRRIQAIKELGRLSSILGKVDDVLMRQISGELLEIVDVARMWESADSPSERNRKYIGQRYRDALILLAKEFGFSG